MNDIENLLADNTKILSGLREEWLLSEDSKVRTKWEKRIDEALDQRSALNKMRNGT